MARGKGVQYEELADATIEQPRDAVVQMLATSICGSDLHLLDYDLPTSYPIGHEAIGVVVERGSGVTGLSVGDRVLLAGDTGCGLCRPCMAGEIKRCKNNGFGIYGTPGGLGGCQAELIRVPNADFNTMKIPDNVSDVQALALTDCLPTAYNAVVQADIPRGGIVVVIGLGPIGLIATELAFLFGAACVFAVDLLPDRLERAKALGAVALGPDEVEDAVRAATSGDMADSVIEAVGSKPSVDLALKLTGANRTLSILGAVHGVDVAVPFESALRGVTLRTDQTTEIPKYWSELVPLVKWGRVHPEAVFTDTFELKDGVQAYQKARSRDAGTIKILLKP
ncbi:alcohol dehydrogenase catalytic domain-containing protein [Mycobacterium sp. 48b]|uniref:alcohol dehydrogenase catalytic domain-containing protein n=1 Tax=Mycobacterium sp. 48b TaxID=3400426 RepID=UPI003AAFDB88